MSLFPHRQSNADFLAFYNTLKDDEEANGIDLQANEQGEEEERDDALEEVKGLIDTRRLEDDEAAHKDLDASRRADEQREVEALARRFEERAHNFFDEDDAYERSGGNVLLREMQTAARKAARKEEVALRRAQEEAAEQARKAEAERMVKASAALESLYELYATDPTTADTEAPSKAPAVQKRKAARKADDATDMATEGSSATTGKRYRIKKKQSSTTEK